MKSIFKSKTIWLAVTQGILGVIIAAQSQYPDAGGLLIVKSILDIVIRLQTDKSIE